jgi:hypothetical protein
VLVDLRELHRSPKFRGARAGIFGRGEETAGPRVGEVTRCPVGHENDRATSEPRKLRSAADCFVVRMGNNDANARAVECGVATG